jgi:hypothetical protein
MLKSMVSKILLVGFVLLSLSSDLYSEEDWEDEGYEDEEYPAEAGASLVVSILDLLDENRGQKLKPADFIFPFSGQHTPMLANRLVASVQGVASGFHSNRVVQQTKRKRKGRRLKSRNVGQRFGITVPNAGVDLVKQASTAGGDAEKGGIRRLGGQGGRGKKKKVVMPEFEISGKFGTVSEQFIVVGNRYYTIDDRLKGSRNLRKVRLVGIDNQFAYFIYKDVSFVKKIRALESVF